MSSNRFERQLSFLGRTGQKRIRDANVIVIGVGGIGSHVIQQLALLGVGAITVIDPDELESTNLNRLVGATAHDLIPGTKKTHIAKRLVRSIDPSISIETVPQNLMSRDAFSAVKRSSYVFGCLDNDGSRLVLNELCIAFEIPYLDLASDIIIAESDLHYGGRVFVNYDDNGCIICYDLISPVNASRDLSSPESLRDYQAIYGVPNEHLEETGPSVVSINGIVASLATTEFMVLITGLREPNRYLNYNGLRGVVTKNEDSPYPNCFYCKTVRGQRQNANVEKYL